MFCPLFALGMAQIDPAITRFEEQCERLGLHHDSIWVPHAIRANVKATQTLRQRLRWFLSGYWDGLILYRITLPKDRPAESCARGHEHD